MKIITASKFHELHAGQEVEVIGRVVNKRARKTLYLVQLSLFQGKITGVIEITADRPETNLRIGDLIRMKGKLFISKKGKKNVQCSEFSLISRPTSYKPEDHRIVQTVINRNKLQNICRGFFSRKGILEIDSKILSMYIGSPDTRHFVTVSKEDSKCFLRSTLELNLRRYTYRTKAPVFEIGHVFRDVDLQKSSLNEFKVLEAQIPYQKLDYGLSLLQKLLFKLEQKFNLEGKLLPKKIINSKDFITIDNSSSLSEIRKGFKKIIKSQMTPTLIFFPPMAVSYLCKNESHYFAQRVIYCANVGEIAEVYEAEFYYQVLSRRFEEQNSRRNETDIGKLNTEFLDDCKHYGFPSIGLYIGLDRLLMLITGNDLRKSYI